jgi:hypothetical protein
MACNSSYSNVARNFEGFGRTETCHSTRPSDRTAKKTWVHFGISFRTRLIALSFLAKLSEHGRSTKYVTSISKPCWVDLTSLRFGVHAKAFRSRSVLSGCVLEFAHVGPVDAINCGRAYSNEWKSCVWDGSDFEHVEELESTATNSSTTKRRGHSCTRS